MGGGRAPRRARRSTPAALRLGADHPGQREAVRPDPGDPGPVKQGITVTAPDRESLLDPGPALEHADRLLRQADPVTAGMWARTATRLIRLALERAADRYCRQP